MTSGAASLPSLLALADRLRDAARGALLAALRDGSLDALARPAHVGAGDVTYGIDVPTEGELSAWLVEHARAAPLSLLTEDTGWRHVGPDGRGGTRDLSSFDHGGPRIVVDPIDGTRNLMTDMRPAWSVIGAAAPGAGEPRLSDIEIGVLAEIPDSRAAVYRVLFAQRDKGCRCQLRRLADDERLADRRLEAGHDDRADHGYFPFFKYMADLRPAIATIEAAFFERLARFEAADVRNCYDDQYISNGGQLALLALGQYRMIADLRAHLAALRDVPTLTSKPYDIAGAVLCAREAGCVITDAVGAPLDFPIDVTTSVSFVGWANRATQRRLEKHLAAALLGFPRSG